MIGRKEGGSPSEVKPNLHPTIFSFLPLICIILLFCLLHMALRKEGQLLVVKTVIIIRSKFFFLFIGRELTTSPANNCLQIMVCSCAMPSNCVWLQIIFCTCIKETVLLSLLRLLLRENGRSLRFPRILIKKTTQ